MKHVTYRREYTELVLLLSLIFDGSTIRNSWASALAAATLIIQKLVYIESIRYSILRLKEDILKVYLAKWSLYIGVKFWNVKNDILSKGVNSISLLRM